MEQRSINPLVRTLTSLWKDSANWSNSSQCLGLDNGLSLVILWGIFQEFTLGVSMEKQLLLFLEAESDTDVWPSVPEADQKEAIEQFARLMICAAEEMCGEKAENSQDGGGNNE